jgi:tripartite-type tricarboxylate transporter receptor subunit TctC
MTFQPPHLRRIHTGHPRAATPWAQTPPFPSKVIRIVPFGTGGGPIDTLARVYADKLQRAGASR